MCKARFQRSFGARITPKRFSEPNLNSVFYFILVPAEYVCCPLERFEVYAPRGAYFLYLVKNIFFITWGFTIFSPKRKYTEREKGSERNRTFDILIPNQIRYHYVTLP
jgi:hypothetical protein